jgi:ParB/RepB/Spo0J family partition protein
MMGIKNISTTRSAYKISNVNNIAVNWEENPRSSYEGDSFQLLKESIKREGILQPLLGYMNEDSTKFLVRDGHRRFKAYSELLEEGHELPPVPVDLLVDKSDSVTTHNIVGMTMLALVTSSTAEPLTWEEKGNAFKTLKETGLTDTEISKMTGFSPATIGQCLTYVNNVTPEVKEMVDSGQISASNVYKLIASPEINEVEVIQAAKEVALSRASKAPKTNGRIPGRISTLKITGKDIEEVKKIQSSSNPTPDNVQVNEPISNPHEERKQELEQRLELIETIKRNFESIDWDLVSTSAIKSLISAL